MTTKAIIKSIDFNSNTCMVRIPRVETSTSSEFITEATFSISPGVYNGYKEGDVVWVTFEDNRMEQPIVLGKLYLGVATEAKDPRGTINCTSSIISEKAKMPFDTTLSTNIDRNSINTYSSYTSLERISSALKTAETDINRMDTNYGNQFRSVITGMDGLSSEIIQTKGEIRNKVNQLDSNTGAETSFGWSLNPESWTVFSAVEKGEEQSLIDECFVSIIPEIVVSKDSYTGKEVSTTIYYLGINGIKAKLTDDTYITSSDFESYEEMEEWVEARKNEEVETKKKYVGIEDDKWKISIDGDEQWQQTLISSEEHPVLIVNKDGLTLNGNGTFNGSGSFSGSITAKEGYIGKFIIGKEHYCGFLEYTPTESGPHSPKKAWENSIYIFIVENGGFTKCEAEEWDDKIQYYKAIEADPKEKDVDKIKKASGIYSDKYITCFEEEPSENANGVYVGTDGIRLGGSQGFSVNANGTVHAPAFKSSIVEELDENPNFEDGNNNNDKVCLHYYYKYNVLPHPDVIDIKKYKDVNSFSTDYEYSLHKNMNDAKIVLFTSPSNFKDALIFPNIYTNIKNKAEKFDLNDYSLNFDLISTNKKTGTIEISLVNDQENFDAEKVEIGKITAENDIGNLHFNLKGITSGFNEKIYLSFRVYGDLEIKFKNIKIYENKDNNDYRFTLSENDQKYSGTSYTYYVSDESYTAGELTNWKIEEIVKTIQLAVNFPDEQVVIGASIVVDATASDSKNISYQVVGIVTDFEKSSISSENDGYIISFKISNKITTSMEFKHKYCGTKYEEISQSTDENWTDEVPDYSDDCQYIWQKTEMKSGSKEIICSPTLFGSATSIQEAVKPIIPNTNTYIYNNDSFEENIEIVNIVGNFKITKDEPAEGEIPVTQTKIIDLSKKVKNIEYLSLNYLKGENVSNYSWDFSTDKKLNIKVENETKSYQFMLIGEKNSD